MAERPMAPSRQERQADYGQRWGEGAARCFSIEGNFLDEEGNVRLMPVPESFFCPISAAIMVDPVAAVDGCAYEREYIERWFRERRQMHQAITSPATGLELPSTTLMPLVALQRAIEAYLAHRPELRRDHLAGRSFEEAAQVLQSDLLEKQAVNATVHDELRHLREANKALRMQLRRAETTCSGLAQELSRLRASARSSSEDEKNPGAADGAGGGVTATSAPASSSSAGGSAMERPAACEAAMKEPADTASHPVPAGAPTHRSVQAALLYFLVVVAGLFAGGQLHGPVGQREPPLHGAAAELPGEVSSLLSGLNKVHAWVQSLQSAGADFTHVEELPAAAALLAGQSARQAATQGAPTPAPAPTRMMQEPDSVESDCKGPRQNKSKLQEDSLPRTPGEYLTIPEQVELLRTGSPEEKRRAVLALLDQPAPVASAVDPLVKLLEDDSPEVQQVAAVALGALAANSTESQAAIARAGAVPPLVRLLKGHAQLMAANALRNLAANNDKNQVVIARAGGIAPLVKLIKDSMPNIQAEAAAALGNLAGETSSNHHEKQLAIARAGAVPPLVRMLRAETPVNRELAAGALRMLATNNADNQVAIAQAGAIRPLARLLQDDASSVRLEAAAALGNLAFYNTETNYGNQLAIAESGAITPLVRLLVDTAPGVCEAAAGTLRNLVAHNAENQAIVLDAGALGPTLRLLQHGGLAAQLEAAGLLRNLAADNADSQAAIARAGAVAPLLALLEAEVPELQEEAAAALWSLARNNKAIQEAVAQAGGSLGTLRREE